ncbi:hypothetical protein BOX15_Mlig015324g2 [Macrostomum lignano]|uniref:Ubiquitin-like domain-containing protein n=1 Tax=Macrostomum lignano TaxID=282301 RepID=A0A267GYG3_9PLAT|nr:hypothetical protein BOX15_Mlig015324g2 [Macrostomum lignano]
MGNCLRGNPDDIEVSESSYHQRSSSRGNQQPGQQHQSSHHRGRHHRHDNQQQQQQPCPHPQGNPGSTTTGPVSAVASSTVPATAGKNQPLRRERIRWTSDQPLTPSQLRSKREEFWDTAPAFDGRREIWDALRAAACAMEASDHELAQAIISGAGIMLPRGLLTDSYDELGTRYQLPLYVLSAPSNLADSPPPTLDNSGGNGGGGDDADGSYSNGGGNDAARNDLDDSTAEQPPVAPVNLKLRLSNNGRDIRLQVSSEDTVAKAKRRLERHVTSGGGASLGSQRWYCYGRQLTDRMRIKECPIPRGFVIQVVQQQQQQQAAPTGDEVGAN